MHEREIEAYQLLIRMGATRQSAELRAATLARAWGALESRSAPTEPDFSGATNGTEAKWARAGGDPRDLRMLLHGSDAQAEAVAARIEAGPAEPAAIEAASGPEAGPGARRDRIASAAAALESAGFAPARPDYTGCCSESEARLVRAGLSLAEARALLTGDDAEAEAVLSAIQARAAAPSRLQASARPQRPAWETVFERR